MNKVVGIGVCAKDKKLKHLMEIVVEFEEPCTQYEAQQIVLDALGELLYNIEQKGSEENG